MGRSSIMGAITAAGVAALVGTLLLVHRGMPVQAAPSAGIHRCSNIQLLIRPIKGGVALGHVDVIYRIRDLWGGPCSLRGFPGVELLDRNFHSLPTHLKRDHGYIISGIPARKVVLTQQHDAYFALEYHDVPIDNQPCRYAPYLMIIPPNDDLPVVTYSGVGAPCGGDIVVSPVESTPAVR